MLNASKHEAGPENNHPILSRIVAARFMYFASRSGQDPPVLGRRPARFVHIFRASIPAVAGALRRVLCMTGGMMRMRW